MSVNIKTLKQALSLSFLQEIFTAATVRLIFSIVLMDTGDALDIDGDLPMGIYTTNSGTMGTFPSTGTFKYGKIIVFPKRNETRFQICIGEAGEMASRTYYNGKWNSWRILSYTS